MSANMELMRKAEALRTQASVLRATGQKAYAEALEKQAAAMLRPGVVATQAGASEEAQRAGNPTGAYAEQLARAAAAQAEEEEEEEEEDRGMDRGRHLGQRKSPLSRFRKRAPMRIRPFGTVPGPDNSKLILGALPEDGDIPEYTVYGDVGYADVYEDRVELFFPALLAAAAPTVLSAGKELLSRAASGAAQAVVGPAAAPPSEEEEEEEDSCPDTCNDHSHGHPTLRPIAEKRPGQPGIFYDAEDGHYEFFIPALIGAATSLLGPLKSLFGKKKKRQRQQPQGPGPGEPPAVQAAVAKETAAAQPPPPAPEPEETEEEEEDGYIP